MKFKVIKILAFFSCFSFLLNFYYSFADDVEDDEIIDANIIETSSSDISELNLNSRSCIILDRTSKKVLYGKNEFNKVKMASTTNLITT